MSADTREAVRQWMAKAQSDWTAVTILAMNVECPRDVVCFHCQQYVEKLVKALLTLHGIEAPKTHDLRRLTQLTVSFAPELGGIADLADQLSYHGVETRYPDDWREIGIDEMNEMIALAKRFAELLMPRLR